MRADESWLSQAARTCARSAAAYEAALLMTVDANLERTLIELCRERYALLERLLIALGCCGAHAGVLRATLPQPSPAESPYRCTSDALGNARMLDGRLTALIQRTDFCASAGNLGGGMRVSAQ
jgi:hypothetical protein